MKKIQCEVCGSTEIKKVGDDLFECQSCGVQYSKNDVSKLLVEITGEVKIDHTSEIENLLKRAESFEESGDIEQALEYYNRVLDLDSENELANSKQEELESRLEKSETEESRCSYVLEYDEDQETSLEDFFLLLKQKEDVVPDLFKNIRITSVTKEFKPFALIEKSFRGTFTASAGYFKQVPYTDYEKKKKYVNGEWREYTERVTKYRQETDWRPTSGGFSSYAEGVFTLSEDLISIFDKTDNSTSKEFDIALTKQYKNLENLVIKDADASVEEDESGARCKGISFETKLNEDIIKRSLESFNSIASSNCYSSASQNIPGDTYDDLRLTTCWATDTSQDVAFIPLQIIQYEYKGLRFVYIKILNENFDFHFEVYPKCTDIEETNKTANIRINEASQTHPLQSLGYFLIPVTIVLLVVGYMASWDVHVFKLVCGISGFSSLGFMILGKIVKDISVNNAKNAKNNAIQNIKSQNQNELSKEFEVFIRIYRTTNSEVQATNETSSVFSFDVPLDKVLKEIDYTSGELRHANDIQRQKEAKLADKEEKLNEIRTLALENKLEAIKKYIDVYGVGLAEAKEAVDRLLENAEATDDSY